MDFDTLHTRWAANRSEFMRSRGHDMPEHLLDNLLGVREDLFFSGIAPDSLTEEQARGYEDGIFSSDEMRYLISVLPEMEAKYALA